MLQMDGTTFSATLDPTLVVANRLEFLHAHKILTLDGSGDVILLQFMGDACNVWRSTHTSGTILVIKVVYTDNTGLMIEGRGVNGVPNHGVMAFYIGEDTHDAMSIAAPRLPSQITTMVKNGVTVIINNGPMIIPVALCIGGDMKFLMSMLGLCGCSSTTPCLYCDCRQDELCLSMAQWKDKGGLRFRSYTSQMQLAHMHMDEEYTCPAHGCSKVIKPGGPQYLPETEQQRLLFQRVHSGTRPGVGPKVCSCYM
jgi:hypothetical protein